VLCVLRAASDTDRDPPMSLPRAIAVAIVCILAVASIVVQVASYYPRISAARSTVQRFACSNNLKQLSIAFENYHATYHCFPPAYVADKDGRPMHSWRVLILPSVEESGLLQLYRQYDFNEPWNGPHNRRLATQLPSIYRCLSDDRAGNETNYVVVLGSETAWRGSDAVLAEQITDGPANTIMLVETSNVNINWLEPRDLTIEEAKRGINSPVAPSISSNHGLVNVVLWDGSVHSFDETLPLGVLSALLTRSGGEPIAPGMLRDYSEQTEDKSP
jgi:hypothetical protein